MFTNSDLFLIASALFLVIVIVFLIKKAQPARILFFSFIYSYCVCVLGITLFPIPYQRASEIFSPVSHNLVLFRSISQILSNGITKNALYQILGNLILFVPYGIIVSLSMKKLMISRVFPALIAFPLLVELLQLIIGLLIGVSYRSFDIDDILLNTLGGILGFCAMRFVLPKRAFERLRARIKP